MVDLLEESISSNAAVETESSSPLSPDKSEKNIKAKKVLKKTSENKKPSKAKKVKSGEASKEGKTLKKKSTKKQKKEVDSSPKKISTKSKLTKPEKPTESINADEPLAKKVKTDKSPSSEETKTLVKGENSPEVQGDFSKFRISVATQNLLRKKGITYLFPIQIKSFDYVYDGKDVVAQARTGTGKTISFALPLVEKLHNEGGARVHGRSPKVLVMAPTRELAIQVHKDFKDISQRGLSSTCVYGGSSYYPQESAMRSGLDIVVGTPGRILDHINKGNLRLEEINHVVLDEVDQMLDMGFAPSVEEILSFAFTEGREKPPQTLLFSATCPSWVYKTAKKFMRPDQTVHVDTIGSSTVRTATTVQHLAIRCCYSELADCVGDVVQLYSGQHGRAIIFTDTKRDANTLAMCDSLKQHKAQVLHGDIEQRQREITLKAFRGGAVRCLVATNVAARGLDIPEVDLVVQTSPPQDIESYIHRSGRTGRAGRPGACVCFYKPQEDHVIAKVERTAGIQFKRVAPPQPQDLMRSSVTDCETALSSIDKKIANHFMESAKAMAANWEGGALGALAASLACMSGGVTRHSRSMLTSQKNRQTWIFRCENKIDYASFVFNTVEERIGHTIRNLMQDLRLTADGKGAVFDLPPSCTEEVEASWRDLRDSSLAPATTLPLLLESSGGFRGRSGGFGGRSGGFGGRSGGFGRKSGGFRGRSSGGGSFGRGGGRKDRGRPMKRKWGDR